MSMLEVLRPHRIALQVTDLDCLELHTCGIRGVILDLDNTLTRWRSLEVSPEVVTWIRNLHKLDIRACLLSNAVSIRRVEPVAELLGLPWITRAAKPFAHGFRRAMRILQTTPDTTAIIGDQLFTDILGGNRLGLYTVLVEPTDPREAWTTSLLQRPLERLIGRIPKNPATLPPHIGPRLRK